MLTSEGKMPSYFKTVTQLKERCIAVFDTFDPDDHPEEQLAPKSVWAGEPYAYRAQFPAACFSRFRWLDTRQISDEFMLPAVVEGQLLVYHPSLRGAGNTPGSLAANDGRMVAEETTLRVASTWLSLVDEDPTLGGACSGIRVATADAGEADRFGNVFQDESSNILWGHQLVLQFELA